MNLKILIVDDHSIVLTGTKMILESTIPRVVVKTARSFTELLHSFDTDDFDILLLGINTPDTYNLAIIPEIKKINSKTTIIIFSSYDEQVGLKFIQAGADGYINKNSEKDEIIYAVNSVIDNGYYYSQKLMKLALNQLNTQNKYKDPKSLLSDREIEVFELLLEGSGNLEIANKLELHMSTVSTYKKRILEKLCITNVADLIKHYYQFKDL